MRRTLILTAGSLLAIAATARAVNVKTQEVTFPSGSETIAGYLALPESPGKHPALVVIHEDWGLTGWVKEQARRLAGEGYVALAVDLYRGQVAHDPSYAYELMVGTPPDRALRDLEAGIHFLYARPEVNKERIGSIGWSMGGKLSLLLAVNDPFLAACVSVYGSMPRDPAEIQKIHAPVLAIFGADDRYISESDVDDFENAMNAAHKSVDVKVYPHASHGFEDSDNKLGFREGAAEDAWERTISFLDRYLKRP
ncbi:MAG TPA: dienelactone hydrolase family protein [Terriglobia bacterium]|nr:dienelactone hydrolase family protein [Terriglobia bacterium]